MMVTMSQIRHTSHHNPADALAKFAGCCLVFSFLWALPIAYSDKIEKFDAKPVHVLDRFENDTRKDYKIAGNVTWSTLKLTLPKDAVVARVQTIGSDFRFDCELWPKEMKEGEPNVSKINLPMTQGYELVIVISRVNKGNQILRQAEVVELQVDAPKSPPKVDQLRLSPVFSQRGDVERWSIAYKNGVLEMQCGGQLVARAYSQALTAWCQAVALSQVAGSVELTRFSLNGHEAGYSADQRRGYDHINALRPKAEELAAKGDVKLAVQTELQRIPLSDQVFGPDFVVVGLAEEWVAHLADSLKHWDAAKQHYQKAADAYAKAVGSDHPYTERMRVWTGYETAMLDQIDEGEALARPAAMKHFELAGTKCATSREIFGLLENMWDKQAEALLKLERFEQCQQRRREMAELCASAFGPKDFRTQQLKEDADFHAQIAEAAGERQAALVKLHLDIKKLQAMADNNETAVADQMCASVLADSRRLLGNQHAVTADMIDFASSVKMNEGDFGEALDLAKEVVAIRKQLNGEDNAAYAYVEGELASVHSQLEHYAEAAPLFVHALKVLSLPEQLQSAYYAQIQLDYGRHLMRTEKYPEAQAQLTQCIKTFVANGQASSPGALKACERLANSYRAQGDLVNADAMLDHQRQLLEQRQGDKGSGYIEILTQEAMQLCIKRRYDESVKKYQDALVQIDKIFGRRGRAYEAALEGLLEVRAIQGNRAATADVFGQLLELARQRRESLFGVSSIGEQFQQSATDRVWLNRLMLLASQNCLSPAETYEHILEIKGAATVYQRRVHLAAESPALKNLFERQQGVNAAIWAMVGRPLSTDDQQKLDERVAERNALEAEMSRKSDAYRAASDKCSVARLQELLPEGTILVDYVEYDRPADWLEQLVSSGPQRQIAAFVVPKKGDVSMVTLGAADAIGALVFQWRRAIAAEESNLVGEYQPQLETDVDRAGGQLRKSVWDPITSLIAGSKNVVISADGLLAACPFAALPMADGDSFLIERHSLSYIAAANLLPELWEKQDQTTPAKLVLVGDVEYGPLSKDVASNPLQFIRLPGSDDEVAKISGAFRKRFPAGSSIELVRQDASEKNVRDAVGSASFLHLDTHGFCIPLSVTQGKPAGKAGAQLQIFEPLIAGIALAGANHANGTDGFTDGILWADEIATLDLSSADLVTLSACQTALGDIVAGEGMQGCQRALFVAGAGSSLTSLWSVEAYATQAVMSKFYDSLWLRKQNKAASLRESMIYMIHDYPKSESDTGIARGHRCPPALWAGWVLSGDSR